MYYSNSRILPALVLFYLVYFSCIPLFSQELPGRNGKLLRGEKWEPYVPEESADFYVSNLGNDLWSGTLPEPNATRTDGPFATLKRAQLAVRKLKAEVYFPKDEPVEKRWIGSPHPLGRGKDIVVSVRQGFYTLEEPLLFTPEDGGERVETNLPTGAFEYHKLRDHFVTWTAYPGEKPVISGGKRIREWKKEGTLWITPWDADSVLTLVVNGNQQVCARTPDTGYFVPPAISSTTSEILFRPGEIKNWNHMEDNRVVMLLRWHTGINRIISVDENQGIARFERPQEGVVIVPPRYYVENVKDLLDTPGEWYFDKKEKTIRYFPLQGMDNPGDYPAEVPSLRDLLIIKGETGRPVRNLRFYGLVFEGTVPGGSAVRLEYTHACELAENEFRACSGRGVHMGHGGYQNRISGNIFRKIDNGAIYVHGPEMPRDGREITRETLISHNQLYDCGGIGIYAQYTLMTTISHNYITRTRGRYAIDVGGWANQEEAIDGGYLVEYNHLDDVQKDADDSGAIKTAGLTFNSLVRRNLIHGVHAGFFNDNVAFWFDNMSSGWTTEENIYYSLEQGEMKYCAALPEDNVYRNNFVIAPPEKTPEMIIEGEPSFTYKNLRMEATTIAHDGVIPAGTAISVTADVHNSGSTGIGRIILYLDGKMHMEKPFPVIRGNTSAVKFIIRLYDAGVHTVAIGDTPYQTVRIAGEKPEAVFEEPELVPDRTLQGEKVKVYSTVKNLTSVPQNVTADLFAGDKQILSQPVSLHPGETRKISLMAEIPAGEHQVRIGNSPGKKVVVQKWKSLDINKHGINEYGSAKAKPYKIEQSPGRYRITAGGSDFFHAEDSYAAVYVKKISGDFVATVKISGFGDRTHEWFRTGLFVRNDMTQSFDVQPGSKGSVLLFSSPGRAGINYDEFGNGCMHKASSENLPEHAVTPIWLKLVRHGNRFSGYISLDGINWIIERHTTEIPGINKAVDIGLAAGSPDKNQYTVEFTGWEIKTAE